MGTPQHSRTAGHAAMARGWPPPQRAGRGTGDGRALTALRVVTYVLASLTCLVVLAVVAGLAAGLAHLPALVPPR
jgi:hypothetical protein